MKLIFGFALLAALFWAVETLWPAERSQPRWRRDSATDLFYFFFNGIVTRFVVALLLAVALGLTAHAVARPVAGSIAAQPALLQVLEVLLIGDLIGYAIHRAFHAIPALWRFHAIHHSPRQLDWLAAARVHPIETVLSRLVAVLAIYLLGFSSGVLAGYAPFLAIYPIFLHCNLDWTYGPFRWLIASPGWHRWHHSSDAEALDKNFSGLFPFVDALFGTAFFPTGRRPSGYGLGSDAMPDNLLAQLAYPFVRASMPS